MPTICTFYGIAIRMFYNDHEPHFHARYGEFDAAIDIGSLTVLEGDLPRRALQLACDRGALHKVELPENWRLCREKVQPGTIEPLA